MSRFLAAVFCLISTFPLYANQQLRWCAWEFPGGVNFENPAAKAQGPSVDFMRELARRSGFELIISQATPPVRCIKALADGEYDLVVGIIKQDEGRKDIHYIPYGVRHPDRVYLAADDNRRLEQVAQLSTMTLAVVQNFGFHPDVALIVEAMPPQQLIRVNSVQSALEVVAKKRVSAALLPPSLVTSLLQAQPELAMQLREVSFPLSIVKPQQVHIGLSTGCQCPELISAMQTSLQQMTADGSIAAILGDRIIHLH